ncbi:zonular occludens toxin domain-containing protein, partial [Pseudomonas aeruginosa]
MAIKIHHAPNASYKTSGASPADLAPAVRKGSFTITKVSSLTRDRIFQGMPAAPSGADITIPD